MPGDTPERCQESSLPSGSEGRAHADTGREAGTPFCTPCFAGLLVLFPFSRGHRVPGPRVLTIFPFCPSGLLVTRRTPMESRVPPCSFTSHTFVQHPEADSCVLAPCQAPDRHIFTILILDRNQGRAPAPLRFSRSHVKTRPCTGTWKSPFQSRNVFSLLLT